MSTWAPEWFGKLCLIFAHNFQTSLTIFAKKMVARGTAEIRAGREVWSFSELTYLSWYKIVLPYVVWEWNRKLDNKHEFVINIKLKTQSYELVKINF